MGKLQVVVGGQQGSEGKGAITAYLARKALSEGVPAVAIRVAGPNAGHTAYDDQGRAWALRQIPVAAVVDPRVDLVIGPGSEIDFEVLLDEIFRLEAGGIPIRERLYVDGSATMLTQEHKDAEAVAGLTAKLGSTGKGIGACRADRIMRNATIAEDDPRFRENGIFIMPDTRLWVRQVLERDSVVLIEGTQGYGLGLHGSHYPKCTSSDCRAVDFVAMAGLDQNWAHEYEVFVVARTYPIRVAGDSGYLKGETSWEELGLAPEKTTVTQKIRRVGEWDPDLIAEAVVANGGPRVATVALTMADYIVPELAGASSFTEFYNTAEASAIKKLTDLIVRTVRDSGTRISLMGTSPNTVIDMSEPYQFDQAIEGIDG